MTVASALERLIGPDSGVRIEAADGSVGGDLSAATTLRFLSPRALSRMLWSPGELGFVRALVEGEVEVDGDLHDVFALRDSVDLSPRSSLELVRDLVRTAGRDVLRRLPTPPEEITPRGRLHSLGRDKAAVSAHYDLSNEFYKLFLDPSMTYSCAVFEHADWTLQQAQAAKHELSLRKLALTAGMRLLDVGCGWGAHVIHAARHFDVEAVGVTLSHEQAQLAQKHVAQAGVTERIEIRERDYREVVDGPFDAISSIGMFEHVGRVGTPEFVETVRSLLQPGGRLLLHSITDPRGAPSRRPPATFINRYIFPDGELQRVGEITDAVQRGGLEVAHVEALNLHYATTLEHWRANLERQWDDAVGLVGERRTKIWHLYLVGTAWAFQTGRVQVHQILATRPHADGRSAVPPHPDWDPHDLGRCGG